MPLKKTLAARTSSKPAEEIADTWFFETVVRLHRAGEGAPYTGLKPAGLDEGPVIPRVNLAVEQEKPDEIISFLNDQVKKVIAEKFSHVLHTKKYDVNDVPASRKYVQTYLGLTLFPIIFTNFSQELKHTEKLAVRIHTKNKNFCES